MDSIITIKNLKKNYATLTAVNGIDFSVERGKLFAFLGPNGAGKSTTINIICTLLKPDHGEILIDGLKIGKDDDAIRRRIGVVFQDNVLDDRLTVKENLTVRAKFYMKNRGQIRESIKRAAQVAGVDDFINRPYGTLSGGQRRRADIARALLNTPQILFLDEPTTGLDPQTRKSVWDMVSRLQKELNMTVFLTTHYMEEAAMADNIIIINNGEIAVSGTPYELREKYSADLLKIKPHSDFVTDLREYLTSSGYEWYEKEQIIQIKIKDSRQAIEILGHSRDWIASFEKLNGTMDDVFLNVAGRELD
ncbi:MAG: ABC transporter ATP-binding protein [Lachnospiraceae bacterium]|nr:ABC transporter ATP-binding protein [Lachnospiraceae bacterium]